MMLAQTYTSRGRLDDALAQYDSVIQKQPKSVAARTMAALIVEAQGRRDEAIKRYESVLAIDERAPVAANNLAFHLADSGTNLDKALQLAQAAIAGGARCSHRQRHARAGCTTRRICSRSLFRRLRRR